VVVFPRQVGVVSDYDLLALDSISGSTGTMMPNLNTFNENFVLGNVVTFYLLVTQIC
jgi:hypothetical protein